jgi:hypothetical protein
MKRRYWQVTRPLFYLEHLMTRVEKVKKAKLPSFLNYSFQFSLPFLSKVFLLLCASVQHVALLDMMW